MTKWGGLRVVKAFRWRISYMNVMGMRRLHWWRHTDGSITERTDG